MGLGNNDFHIDDDNILDLGENDSSIEGSPLSVNDTQELELEDNTLPEVPRIDDKGTIATEEKNRLKKLSEEMSAEIVEESAKNQEAITNISTLQTKSSHLEALINFDTAVEKNDAVGLLNGAGFVGELNRNEANQLTVIQTISSMLKSFPVEVTGTLTAAKNAISGYFKDDFINASNFISSYYKLALGESKELILNFDVYGYNKNKELYYNILSTLSDRMSKNPSDDLKATCTKLIFNITKNIEQDSSLDRTQKLDSLTNLIEQLNDFKILTAVPLVSSLKLIDHYALLNNNSDSDTYAINIVSKYLNQKDLNPNAKEYLEKLRTDAASAEKYLVLASHLNKEESTENYKEILQNQIDKKIFELNDKLEASSDEDIYNGVLGNAFKVISYVGRGSHHSQLKLDGINELLRDYTPSESFESLRSGSNWLGFKIANETFFSNKKSSLSGTMWASVIKNASDDKNIESNIINGLISAIEKEPKVLHYIFQPDFVAISDIFKKDLDLIKNNLNDQMLAKILIYNNASLGDYKGFFESDFNLDDDLANKLYVKAYNVAVKNKDYQFAKDLLTAMSPTEISYNDKSVFVARMLRREAVDK